jgi:N utilization substance protein B
MGKRRKGRELLVQALYASRASGADLFDTLADQLERRKSAAETEAFARALARKIYQHRAQVESWLGLLLRNWSLERVGEVERAILVVGLTELRHSPEVPYRVVINEACELARLFCDEDAVSFINGVLDRAKDEVLAAEARDEAARRGADGDEGGDRGEN